MDHGEITVIIRTLWGFNFFASVKVVDEYHIVAHVEFFRDSTALDVESGDKYDHLVFPECSNIADIPPHAIGT